MAMQERIRWLGTRVWWPQAAATAVILLALTGISRPVARHRTLARAVALKNAAPPTPHGAEGRIGRVRCLPGGGTCHAIPGHCPRARPRR
jgi:hypothetical protein